MMFFSAEDSLEYLAIIQDYCRRYVVDIWGYCLMSNHVHLIAVPVVEESLGHQSLLQPLNNKSDDV